MQLLKRIHIVRRRTWFLLVICLVGVVAGLLAWVVPHQAGQGSLWSTNRTTAPEDTANWQTYTDTEHGFSFRYPTEWDRLPPPSASTRAEPAGIKITAYTVYPCTTAADYLSKKYPPSYPDMTRKPLHLGSLDGLLVARPQLGRREAVILNCPYAIHIGLNPIGVPHADQLFLHVLSTVQVWKPEQRADN